jgi:CRISPR/Cas system CSM-associated protein Csm3 (group 7 of RAMP superfamily)
MLLEHVRFSFDVELASDTHIGDGEEVKLDVLRPNAALPKGSDDRDEIPSVATIARDHAGKPFLPSTALKGALRKRLETTLSKTEVEGLFGAIKNDDEGAMGRFAFYPGKWNNARGRDAQDLPHWSTEQGSWIATHVAISRETGTADHMKLYNQEMLAAGSGFSVSGVWFGTLDEAKSALAVLLAALASREGLQIGAGHKLGLGALRFTSKKDQVLLLTTRFDADAGTVVTDRNGQRLTVQPAAEPKGRIDLKLHCEGPFISVDTTRKKGANDGNQIKALKRNAQTPVVHVQTLAGALRARAAWLSACEGMGGDDRFKNPSEWSHPAELTPVERLFGVSGWRGLVRFSQTESAGAKELRNLTSIALDRFSGALLDSALFEYEVFTGVELDVSLRLEERRGPDGRSFPDENDKRLLKLLLKDLAGDKLTLGHATNRGFGWFDVRVSGAEHLQENS